MLSGEPNRISQNFYDIPFSKVFPFQTFSYFFLLHTILL